MKNFLKSVITLRILMGTPPITEQGSDSLVSYSKPLALRATLEKRGEIQAGIFKADPSSTVTVTEKTSTIY